MAGFQENCASMLRNFPLSVSSKALCLTCARSYRLGVREKYARCRPCDDTLLKIPPSYINYYPGP